MILKWGDKDKMVCETCENNRFGLQNGEPEHFCQVDMPQYNPWQTGGGRGCPMWQPRIDVPDGQVMQ